MAEQDFNSQVIEEFRANGGRVGGMLENMSLLLLHHTGAKSGQERIAPLAYAEEVTGDERQRLFDAQVRRAPGFGDYQEKAGDRVIPVIVLTPTGDAG